MINVCRGGDFLFGGVFFGEEEGFEEGGRRMGKVKTSIAFLGVGQSVLRQGVRFSLASKLRYRISVLRCRVAERKGREKTSGE